QYGEMRIKTHPSLAMRGEPAARPVLMDRIKNDPGDHPVGFLGEVAIAQKELRDGRGADRMSAHERDGLLLERLTERSIELVLVIAILEQDDQRQLAVAAGGFRKRFDKRLEGPDHVRILNEAGGRAESAGHRTFMPLRPGPAK